jgi:FAD/FMN-containing dehydrogenase
VVCRDTVPAGSGDPDFRYVERLVRDLSVAQLRMLDCGTRRPADPAADRIVDTQIPVSGARMTTLPEVFDLVRRAGGGWPGRRTGLNLQLDVQLDTAGDETNVAWTRAFWSELEPWSGGRTYFNFPGAHEEADAALRASYGANYERLVDIKTAWDPDNVFNTGQNIRPRR